MPNALSRCRRDSTQHCVRYQRSCASATSHGVIRNLSEGAQQYFALKEMNDHDLVRFAIRVILNSCRHLWTIFLRTGTRWLSCYHRCLMSSYLQRWASLQIRWPRCATRLDSVACRVYHLFPLQPIEMPSLIAQISCQLALVDKHLIDGADDFLQLMNLTSFCMRELHAH